MKKQILNTGELLLLAFLLFFTSLYSQVYSTFTTSGNQILDRCTVPFVIRGVNYSLADDWKFPDNLNTGGELSSQIALANPNTVRIQWYADYGQPSRPQLTIESLDSVISRFARNGIVSMLELHDFTHIHTDTTAFNNQILNWWLSPAVLQLINKHQNHLFLNVANEYGPAMYPAPNYTLNPNYNTEITNWVKHYKSIITKLRAAQIAVPIVIDAPNYGMDYQTVINHAAEFNTHDPLHRIIMSCHAYWNLPANDVQNIVNQLSQLTVPVIFGEVGNVDFSCTAIPLETVLQTAQTKNMGWLAWSWHRDGECPTRNMTANETAWNSTTDGQFSSLTAYGNTIVNNAQYGLKFHAEKATDCTVGVEGNQIKLKLYPNPVSDKLIIDLDNIPITQINIYNLEGRKFQSINGTNQSSMEIQTGSLDNGIYILEIETTLGKSQYKFIK